MTRPTLQRLRPITAKEVGSTMNRWRLLVAAAGVLFPTSASADVITPLSYVTVPFLPVIILIEALVFLILARKWLRVAVGFRRVLRVMALANVVTSFAGTVVPLYRYVATNLAWIAAAFLASVLIEWVIYLPFFRRARLRKRSLLALALATNLATYVPLATLFALRGDEAPGPRPSAVSEKPPAGSPSAAPAHRP